MKKVARTVEMTEPELRKELEEKKYSLSRQCGWLNKKRKRFSRWVTVFVAAGAALGLYAAHRKNRSAELEAQNDISTEKYYDAFLQARKLTLSGNDTEKITLKALCGAVELELKQLEPGRETFLSLESVMSGVLIQVPEGIRVRIEENNQMSSVVNRVPEPITEAAPTLYIEIKGVCCGVLCTPYASKQVTERKEE